MYVLNLVKGTYTMVLGQVFLLFLKGENSPSIKYCENELTLLLFH